MQVAGSSQVRSGSATAGQLSRFSRLTIQRILISLVALFLVLLVVSVFVGVRFRNENRDLAGQLLSTRVTLSQQRDIATRAAAVYRVLSSPTTVRVGLAQGSARPTPEGKAFYEPGSGGLIFYAANLSSLSSNQVYELWLLPMTGNPISGGTFNTDSKGNGGVALPALPAGIRLKAFSVTIEPTPGKIQPSGATVLTGSASK